MKYSELIEKMKPYANEDVDILVEADDHVSFWAGGGEYEICQLETHK